jgi:hypothetical protein
MRRFLSILMALTLVFAVGAMAAVYGGPGPASSSEGGISDGSGFEVPPEPVEASGPLGPNPLAGDGIPDGSDLDMPNGPNGV